MLGVTDMKDSGEVDVFISNWDITDIDLGPGALVGYCSPVAVKELALPLQRPMLAELSPSRNIMPLSRRSKSTTQRWVTSESFSEEEGPCFFA